MRAFMYIELPPVSHTLGRPQLDLNSAHSFRHDVVNCKNRCNRRLNCGHPCMELCHLPCKSGCACEKEFQSANHAEAATASSGRKTCPHDPQAEAANYAMLFDRSPEKTRTLRHSLRHSGSPQRDLPQATQPFRDFAAGGHLQSDENLVTLMEREAAEARGRQLDEDNYAALFGDPGDDVLIDGIGKMTLVHTMSNGKGGDRGVWKGTYKASRIQDASTRKKEEPSLLDS